MKVSSVSPLHTADKMKHISLHLERVIQCKKKKKNEHSLPPVASHDTPASFLRHSHSFNTFGYTTNLIHLKLKVQKSKFLLKVDKQIFKLDRYLNNTVI